MDDIDARIGGFGAQLGDRLAVRFARHCRLDAGRRLETRLERLAPVELDLAIDDDLLRLRQGRPECNQQDHGRGRAERGTHSPPPHLPGSLPLD
jgi:hypothetical protein